VVVGRQQLFGRLKQTEVVVSKRGTSEAILGFSTGALSKRYTHRRTEYHFIANKNWISIPKFDFCSNRIFRTMTTSIPDEKVPVDKRLVPDTQSHLDGSTVDDNRHSDHSDNKSHTFRKRRLSLPMHHCLANSNEPTGSSSHDEVESNVMPESRDNNNHHQPQDTTTTLTMGYQASDASEDKAHTFRKRRLSLTFQNSTEDAADVATSTVPYRRASVDSYTSSVSSSQDPAASTGNNSSQSRQPLFKSRILHSSELIGGDVPPPSPAHDTANVLYQQTPLPPPNLPMPLGPTSILQPKWKKRRTLNPETECDKLPFSTDIVGTWSCHGVEPLYGSEYDDEVAVEVETDDIQNPAYGESTLYGNNVSTSGTHGTAMQQSNFIGNSSQEATTPPSQQPQEDDEELPVTVAKINQDRGGVAFPYGNCPKTALFAVYDGHGNGGELVSQFALHEIQRRLEKHPTFHTDIEKALKETFQAVDDALRHEPLIEPLFAGTTACVALLRDRKLTIANAGDSRAVCARKLSNGNYLALELTEDQNPDKPEEMERIVNSGGYVTLPPGPGLSARVWLDPMCSQIGLAMSRSIGDHAIASVGVISEPVVTSHDVTEDDEFLILASDGVWEFIKSIEAVQVVGANLYKGATKACQALIEAAAAKWHEEEGAYRDDITAIVVRLQDLWKAATIDEHTISQSHSEPSAKDNTVK
jgi:serine/threonine protein phosphatase PrpC